MQITEETIPLIEKALDINIREVYKNDEKLSRCICLALSDIKIPKFEMDGLVYTPPDGKPYFNWQNLENNKMFLDVWHKLKKAGLPVRELSEVAPRIPKHASPLWYLCNKCDQKLCRIGPDSMARKIYLWCKHCKKEVEVNIN